MIISDPAVIWKSLKGIICIYKPASESCRQVRRKILYNICTDLNSMCYNVPNDYVKIEEKPQLSVTVTQNLVNHPLVSGPKYQMEDMKCSWSNFLGFNTSGILLYGLRNGTNYAKRIRESKLLRTYRIKGRLGQITSTGLADGKVVEKSTWRHVKLQNLEKLLSVIQISHQKQMFRLCGVDIQSQTAYEMASEKAIRPANSSLPVLYGLKCVAFEPPDFTIEVQCINEYEDYLVDLIREIGIKLHSTAYCTGLQCIRHGYFTLDDALLKKHWTLENILANMQICDKIMEQHSDILRQKSAALQ